MAAFVFDTLTTTKTATTATASKAGLFYELQYDASSVANPLLIGGKILNHRLERTRIASVPTGERSFHVLYYLLAGTSDAEKSHLGLDGVVNVHTSGTGGRRSSTISHKRWRYLGHPTQLKVGINDAEGFQHFKSALRKLEFPRSEIAEICQVLATILHIGQLEFATGQATRTGPEESGGYSHEGGETVTIVKNKDALEVVAAFLGVGADELETSLGHRTKTIHRERVTVMLDPKGARANADEFARTLYSLFVAYVVEHINQKICAPEDTVANTISVIDFPGFAQSSATGSTLDQLLNNAATECLYHSCLQSFFERPAETLETEEVNVPATSYFDNSDAFNGLLKHGNGLLSILDDQTRRGRTDMQLLESLRKRYENKNPAITAGSATAILPGSNFATTNTAASFTVKHFAGEVQYPVTGLVEENGNLVSGDLMNLIASTRSTFVRDLFGQEAMQTVHHPNEKTAIMQAQVSSKPLRMPSMARRKIGKPSRLLSGSSHSEEQPDDLAGPSAAGRRGTSRDKKNNSSLGPNQGVAAQFLSSLDAITQSLSATNVNPYFVFCLKPNDRRIANQFDTKCVRTQVQTFGIAEISQRLHNVDFSVFLPFAEFLGLAELESVIVGSDQEKSQLIVDERRWPDSEARIGSTGVFLSERCWAELAKVGERVFPSYTRATTDDSKEGPFTPGGRPGDSKVRLVGCGDTTSAYGDDPKAGYFGTRDLDGRSEAGASAFHSGDMFKNLETREQLAEKNNEKEMEEVEDVIVSGSRKRWLAFVYFLTWYIPDFLIKAVGRMKRKDIRLAWREKFAINLIIWFFCAVAVFFIVGLPFAICPTQHVYSAEELTSKNGKSDDAFISIRGEVFDLGSFAPSHYPSIVPEKALMKYAGMDVSDLFPVQVHALCIGRSGPIDPSLTLNYRSLNETGLVPKIGQGDPNSLYHDFRHFRDDYREKWYFKQMERLRLNYKKGEIGFTPQYMKKLGAKRKNIAYMYGRVYDLSDYIAGDRVALAKDGEPKPVLSKEDKNFMHQGVVDLFQEAPGQDIAEHWEGLPLDATTRRNMKKCLDNLFRVGAIDTRNSPQCQFSQYFILAISIILVTIIGFKFLAALQFSKKNVPEDIDKFIICQVPAYTEDEESLRRAIDSMARMKYDDKRKLLVIVCDGMIIGQGNDRPTPRIVLDILGVSETVDPEPLSFESLGEGMKQHNMGKVYSGLYEAQGHIVPFLVVVKIGKPSEVSRPGNRGKRDSQMLLMRFLNRVHYNHPMNPLELEIHHQIRNVIGVNPAFYEFVFQVDADTIVAPDSATRMVGSFLNDTRIIALCGETALNNAKSSIITMIQVYEYYISHNLTKAFESLFGSVTCLPGCFSMYRVRTADTGKPLFISQDVVDGYSEIRVDTLHMKNLLHLGEDRYLTTLLLKHHPTYKTKFLFNAHAWTIAPESWTVFLSQRRRWINSTIHNLIELIPLQQLCGFCCFSMRFIVFVDLLTTVIQPVTVAYIIYLIVMLSTSSGTIPMTAFIMIAAIYGLQAIIFILRRKWEMVGWMIVYILAMPIFAFGLPLYSFWHMDDFSWGNTRIVTGEKGRKVVITDEGKFDPSMIPKRKWEEYQIQLLDSHASHDDHSEVSGISYGTKSYHPGASSEYGFPQSRPMSHMEHPRYSSHMSLSGSEMLGGRGYEMEMVDISSLPSDDVLLAEIRDILQTADLMNVTKKSVKLELESRFNVNLNAKRAYINSGKL